MEGNPLRSKRTESASREESGVPAPEYWVEREALPFSRDYVAFQVRVAKELAAKLKVPLRDVVEDYTTVFHSFIFSADKNNLDIERMSDEELTDAIYEVEEKHSKSEPLVTYHDGNRYGCFSYHAHAGEGGKGRVDIHFSNAEFDEGGPLGQEKVGRRLHELKDLFTSIKKNYPDAQYVQGDSWLYNVPAYKRLFPETYVSNPEIDTSPSSLATGRTWGQFCDDRLELKKDVAEQFLKNIRTLQEVTPETVIGALPYQALRVRAPIQEFYKKYGVE